MPLSNAERCKRYRERKQSRGARRLNVYVPARALARLEQLRNEFESLGGTLTRVIMARKAGDKNVRAAFLHQINTVND